MGDVTQGTRLVPSGPDTRRESTERRILEGAQALIDGGQRWHAIGIRQIAEHAEISRTAFYDFFGSKNEVLEHLIRGLHEDLTVSLQESLDLGTIGRFDPQLMRPTLQAVAAYAARHGYAYRAFLEATADDAGLATFWNELLDAYARLVAAAIEGARAHDATVPNAGDARALARALILMTERCLIAELDRESDAGTVDALVEIWVRAVFGDTASS
ncbi:MAG: TetR/AcrR family transcriptional regulator [Patulibacter minatonensis]